MSNKRRCLSCKEYDYPQNGIVCNVGFFCGNKCRNNYANSKTTKQMQNAKLTIPAECEYRMLQESQNK